MNTYLVEISWFEESILTRRQSVRLVEASSKELAEQVVRKYVDDNMKSKELVKIIVYDTLR